MLTVAQAINYARVSAGGSPPGGIDWLALLNQAGRWLCMAHQWVWLERLGTISLVEDQEYAALPSGLQRLLSTPRLGAWSNTGPTIDLTDMQSVLSARASNAPLVLLTGQYIGAIVYTQTGSVIGHRLELYPTPEANATVPIHYRADWTIVTSDGDILALPSWLETIYLEALRAHVRAVVREDDERGTLAERLVALQASPLFREAKIRDGQEQLPRRPTRP